ncbi:MAG: hemolysin III family protein [Acidimicrobiales bacterium]
MQLLDDPRAEHLSPSARRLLRRPRPRFRGLLHRWAAVASVAIGIVLVVGADGSRAATVMAIFAFGNTAMLGVSAIVHLRDWPIERVEMMVRLDHTTIFLMFATTATPIAVLGLDGAVSTWLLAVAWTGALLGIAAEWTPVHPPAGVMNAAYLVFGWSMLVFVPWMIAHLTLSEVALLLGGGAAYTVGAIVVGARWPDPWTDSFGYHEIWHVFVVVGVALHTAMAVSLAW